MSRQIFQASRRKRVQGDGPNRSKLPNFSYIGDISSDVQYEILQIVEDLSNINDIYGKNYSVSKFCDLKRQLPKEHINILLQKPIFQSDGMEQKDYKVWMRIKSKGQLKKFLENKFPNSYRTRIARLFPKTGINWHIDMNTKVSCRFHILIKNPQFIFEINRKGIVDQIPFKERNIFFTNTAYPHRVYNPTEEERISLLLDIDYKDVQNILPTISE